MSAQQRREVVRYRWSKAQGSLACARRELEAGACDFAVNRLYYAVFYGVSAALLERELHFRRHSGVRAAFHRQLVKTGLLDVEWGRFYDQVFEDRQEADYVPLTTFEPEYIEHQPARCAGFLAELCSLLSSLSPD